MEEEWNKLRLQILHRNIIIYLMFMSIGDAKYLWRCFVWLVIRRHQFMWKRNILFFFVWISVMPVLLGRLIDLMIVLPSLPLNENPVYSSLFFQEWLIGILFTTVDCLQTEAWQGKVERIKREGIDQLPFNWLIVNVIGSAIQTLLLSLIVPYLVSLFLGALFGATYSVQRLVWPAFFVLIAVPFIYKGLKGWIIHVHNVESDRLRRLRIDELRRIRNTRKSQGIDDAL